MQVPRRGTRSGADSQVRGENCYNRVMGAGSMPEVGRGVQLQRAIFVSYCQKEGGGKPAFKINLTPMEAFHPTVAQALLSRLEIHYTPKHGSWLNIAEIELSALTRQCLNRRIPTIDVLKTKNKCLEPATQPIPEGC